jgi:1-acyl-sn-glycerol-3-phosphate acyltransferase
MQPFKSGTGLIAVEGATPVVPMKLKVYKPSVLDRGDREDWKNGRGFRGNVEVVFGAPLYFPALTDPADATRTIEAAVAAL